MSSQAAIKKAPVSLAETRALITERVSFIAEPIIGIS